MLLLSFVKPNLRMFENLSGVHVSHGFLYRPLTSEERVSSNRALRTSDARCITRSLPNGRLMLAVGDAGEPEPLILLSPSLCSLLNEDDLSLSSLLFEK
jgi:hypothetical protein